jgi:hypothetical protein
MPDSLQPATNTNYHEADLFNLSSEQTSFSVDQYAINQNSLEFSSQLQPNEPLGYSLEYPSQPQTTINTTRPSVHSSQQLFSRQAANLHNRPYHSEPIASYRQSNGYWLPASCPNNASEPMLPTVMGPQMIEVRNSELTPMRY